MNISLNEISQIIAELKLIKNMASLMPDKEVSITLEPEDKREIGSMDISCELLCIKESVADTLNMISDTIDDIYKNAVDEREGYPEDSMTKRALWLDEVQNSAALIRTEISK